jgi:hypothetical protein
VDPFDFFDDAIDGIAEWHYTAGWGNLAVVTVASTAIIASVVTSVVTLRRNASQFEQSRQDTRNDIEQTRLDARNDKLRSAISDLISAIAESQSQAEIATARFLKVTEGYSKENPPTIEEVERSYRAILSEELWDSYRRATTNAYGVLLLTEDTEIARYIGTIIVALAQRRELFENIANPDTHATASEKGGTLDATIEVAGKQLLRYALLNLGVRVYASESDHPIYKTDLFKL